jgi:hypothetical protein
LKYPSRAAKQKTDDDYTDERTRWGMSNKPGEKLQHDNHNEHGDNCEPTTTEDEKCENTGNGCYDNAEHSGNCGDKWRVLKVLLRDEAVGDETACAGPVIDEVLNQGEHPTEEANDRISDRGIACMLHTFVRVVVE